MTKFQTTRGMRDFAPEQMRKKQFIEDTCREVFELYGFQPLQTPAVEDFDLLAAKGSAGEAIKEEIYYFRDKSDRGLGLRFDFTVPLARFVASNPQLAKPFKRYQIGQVWRYDKPGKGRYREFTQADIDIVGTASMYADAEILACAAEVCKRLGLDFYIKLNNRKFLEELAETCSVPKDKIVDCFRSLDKLAKIDRAGVEAELKQKKIPAKILDVVEENNFEKAAKLVGEKSEGLKELRELLQILQKFGIGKCVKIDLSLCRGLEYYTGPVFEIDVLGTSVGGGGRFDKLISVYGGPDTPATGISFGVDRLLDYLETKLPARSTTKVFVFAVNEKLSDKALEICQNLRKLGINAECDLLKRGISKNLDYASKQKIPFCAIVGEQELAKNGLKLKDMESGKEQMVKLNELEKLKGVVK